MSNLIARFYQWLYSQVGGKPWTHIAREDQKKAPLFYMLIFMAIGILIAKLAGKYWWLVIIGFALGVIVGHIWW